LDACVDLFYLELKTRLIQLVVNLVVHDREIGFTSPNIQGLDVPALIARVRNNPDNSPDLESFLV
jgi:hypothetical protein